MNEDEQKIAEFLAKKKPRVIPAGVSGVVQPKGKSEDELIRERHKRTDHLGREHWFNGLGEPL